METIIRRLASPSMRDLDDLAQIIYLILLEYDEEKIVDLWENEQLNFFIVRIAKNQLFGEGWEFKKLKKYNANRRTYDPSKHDRLDDA